jgi:uncharacterized protein (DUF2267 family)
MSDPIASTVDKTRLWIASVARNIGGQVDDAAAYAALRAVLHAVRDRLTVDEAAHFGAQLPMLVRGIYYEGWHPAGKPLKLRHAEEFLALVERDLSRHTVDAEAAVKAVFYTLAAHLDPGEFDKMMHLLGKETGTLFEQDERDTD